MQQNSKWTPDLHLHLKWQLGASRAIDSKVLSWGIGQNLSLSSATYFFTSKAETQKVYRYTIKQVSTCFFRVCNLVILTSVHGHVFWYLLRQWSIGKKDDIKLVLPVVRVPPALRSISRKVITYLALSSLMRKGYSIYKSISFIITKNEPFIKVKQNKTIYRRSTSGDKRPPL